MSKSIEINPVYVTRSEIGVHHIFRNIHWWGTYKKSLKKLSCNFYLEESS